MIYSKIEGGIGCEGRVDLQQGLIAPPPPSPPSKKNPAAKVTSQGHAHVRTDAQIKLLYYPYVFRKNAISFSFSLLVPNYKI